MHRLTVTIIAKVISRHRYYTRLAYRLSYYIPSVRTNYRKFNIRYQGASIWNNIEESTKSLNFHRFKKGKKNKINKQLLINAKAPIALIFQFYLFLFIYFLYLSFVSICIFSPFLCNYIIALCLCLRLDHLHYIFIKNIYYYIAT